MSLRSIEGQSVQADAIIRLIRQERLPHALAITGIAGVGKAAAAVALSMALNCLEPVDYDGCGRCSSCTKILRNRHLDVFVVWPDPPKKKREKLLKDDPELLMRHRDILKSPWPQDDDLSIKIDTVREIIRTVAIKPFEGRYRVMVLPEADLMTEDAANALLKVLEEPPRNNVFVLTAGKIENLLPTIASRCRHIRFGPLAAGIVRAGIEDVTDEEASVIANLSGGSLKRAREIAKTGFLAARRDAVAAVNEAGDLAGKRLFQSADELGKGFVGGLDAILWWLRDVMVLKATGNESRVVNSDIADLTADAAERFDLEELFEIFGFLDRLQQGIRFANIGERLAALVALLVFAGRLKPWEALGYGQLWIR